jgi:hypothetical protein
MRLSKQMRKILLTMLHENPNDTEGWWKPVELARILIPQYRYGVGHPHFLKMESNIYRPLRKLQNEGFVEKSWHRVDRLGMIAYRLTEKGRNEASYLRQRIIKLIEEWKPLVNSN